MLKNEDRATFKNLSFAVIGMRSRIYKSLGLKEEDFFNILSEKGLKILDRSGDVLLFKGPAKWNLINYGLLSFWVDKKFRKNSFRYLYRSS